MDAILTRDAGATAQHQGILGSSLKDAKASTVASTWPCKPVVTKGGQVVVQKLTCRLLKTYNLINKRYYAKKREMRQKNKHPNNGYDDEHHDYIIKNGEKLHNRYVVCNVIGKGSFGQVVKAFDTQENAYVAVKIVKSKSAFYNQAQVEIRILQSLRKNDPNDERNIVSMTDSFTHRNHQCIVFELLSINLYEFLRNLNFVGFSLTIIRKFARQLLTTLEYTAVHQGGVIHCDLKPENILLRNRRHSAIKVIDFGSACFADEKVYSYIQSRFYRAPEVILGCSYSTSIDLWSLGCILVELYTGKPIFNGSNEREQIVQHIDTLGMPPSWMIEKGKKAKRYFEKKGNDWVLTVELQGKEKDRVTRRTKKIDDILGVHIPGGLRGRFKGCEGHTSRDFMNFAHLIKSLLQYNPSARISPSQALKHKFFTPSADTSAGTDSFPLQAKDWKGTAADTVGDNSDVTMSVDSGNATTSSVRGTSNSAPPLSVGDHVDKSSQIP